MRVQIPAYTDRWMMGDRFGAVTRITRARPSNSVRAALLTKHRFDANREIAHVKLDKSGKTVAVVLADCEVVS